MSDVAICVADLVKDFEVYENPLDLALEVLTRRRRHQIYRALDGVSFEVGHGEVFGIIGANGAGKSTLLKIIAGVLDATAGSVDVTGRVTPILELGLGFNPEYSGRENVYLSGLLYGMDKAEVDRKVNGIVEFSGLREFIERPVKTYSSGMQARLAFSIATAVDPEILIIDEALGAGDAMFVQKCLRRIRQFCSSGHTVLMVSHGTGLLAQLCGRVMWLENGAVRMIGPAIQVVQAYDLAAHQGADAESWIETVDDDLDKPAADSTDASSAVFSLCESASAGEAALVQLRLSAAKGDLNLTADRAMPSGAALGAMFRKGGEIGRQVFRRGPVFIESVALFNRLKQQTTRLTMLEPFTLKVQYRVKGSLPKPTLGIALAVNNKYDLAPVAQYMTQNIRPFETRENYGAAADRFKPSQHGIFTLAFDYVPFCKGEYILSLGLLPNEPASWEFYEYRHLYYPFSVDDAGMDVGAPILLNPTLTHTARAESESKLVCASPPTLSATSTSKTLRGEIEQICMAEGGYPDKWPRHHRCPACGEGPLVDAFAKYGFTHSRCASCDFVCVDPYPPGEIIAKLYSGAYYSRIRELFERPLLERGGVGTPFSAPREVLEAVVQRATNERTTGAWLDVGGGLGAFIHLIRELKPHWHATLNEFNTQSIAIARELLDIEIVTGDPAQLLQEDRRFDVVSSVAVLEHVPAPLDFLRSYAALVKPGGVLVTVIPQFTSLNGSVSKGSSSNVVPPYHVSLFNKASLRRLLARVSEIEIEMIEEAGPAAFELIQHVQFGDYWDVEIPTTEHPEPLAFRRVPYEPQISEMLNILSAADGKMGDYFAEKDGRLFLIAHCRKLSR